MRHSALDRCAIVFVSLALLAGCGGDDDAESKNLRTLTFQNTSMEPALEKGQSVTFDTSAACCKRGDIVLFVDPDPSFALLNVKRVVAIGGDTLVFEDGALHLNGEPLDEPYLEDATVSSPTGGNDVSPGCSAPDGGKPGCVVPDGSIYVLGDNRTSSKDSRIWGPIARSSIRGVRVDS